MRRHELRSLALRLDAKDITDFSIPEINALYHKGIETLAVTSGREGLNAGLFRDKDNNFYYCRTRCTALSALI